ncbi:hypothetical protein DMB68_22430 [Flavobacterium hydrophilum]|uniref:Uncharacterized protein n=1 Tax=Flavobacterium hydrophilum TaxID=2211445 RepID=A0A2V4BVA5_9FLAO|nr:hypothetical protein DMB68_22430 [Flavobacterium hydrophilum]
MSNIKYFFMSDILELETVFRFSVRIITNMAYLNLRKIVQIKKFVNNDLAFEVLVLISITIKYVFRKILINKKFT